MRCGGLLFAFFTWLGPGIAFGATKDRVDDATLRARIETAANLVAAGRIVAAKERFATILARDLKSPGGPPTEELDLTTAFGVELCSNNYPTASLSYLKRAIELAKVVFSQTHPEVALAEVDLGDCLGKTAAGKASPERQRLYQEAYQIRLASLGAADPETIASLGNLAQVASLQNPGTMSTARISDVLALYDAAIKQLAALGPDHEMDVLMIRSDRVRFLARTNHLAEADVDVERMLRLGDASPDVRLWSGATCEDLAKVYLARGERRRGRSLKRRCDAAFVPLLDDLRRNPPKPKTPSPPMGVG